jgi:hypothetical protein
MPVRHESDRFDFLQASNRIIDAPVVTQPHPRVGWRVRRLERRHLEPPGIRRKAMEAMQQAGRDKRYSKKRAAAMRCKRDVVGWTDCTGPEPSRRPLRRLLPRLTQAMLVEGKLEARSGPGRFFQPRPVTSECRAGVLRREGRREGVERLANDIGIGRTLVGVPCKGVAHAFERSVYGTRSTPSPTPSTRSSPVPDWFLWEGATPS